MMWLLKGRPLTVTDQVAEALLRDKKNLGISELIRGYLEEIEVHRAAAAKQEDLRQQFVSDFNAKKIFAMQKEDYVTGLQREDTFCCRLERELALPGSTFRGEKMAEKKQRRLPASAGCYIIEETAEVLAELGRDYV